ncbi:MAG: hypothetical protein ACKO96_15470, partial [Flammeovirgaceae bacterium]
HILIRSVQKMKCHCNEQRNKQLNEATRLYELDGQPLPIKNVFNGLARIGAREAASVDLLLAGNLKLKSYLFERSWTRLLETNGLSRGSNSKQLFV